MICVLYTKKKDKSFRFMPGSFSLKLLDTDEEAKDFIDKKVKAGFTCHRFDHNKSFTQESTIVAF